MDNPSYHLDALEGLILYYPALIVMMFHGRRRDWLISKQPRNYKFLGSKTLCHRHDAFLGYALMALLLFPITVWAIIFAWVIIRWP
jgi:hypothetical protein